MMATRGKWTVFLLLLGIWAGIAAWLLLDGTSPQTVPLKYVSGQTGARTVGHGHSNALRLDLALFTANRQNADNAFTAPKNIFTPLKTELTKSAVAVSPHARRKPPQQESAVQAPIPPVPAGPTPEEMAKQAGRQELAKYRYLGYLNRGGKHEAFLSKGNDLHIVKVGESIEQRVVIKNISPDGVLLKETVSDVEQTINLNK